jgi:hypothetical protein
MSLLLDGKDVLTIADDMNIEKNATLLLEFGKELKTGERHILSLVDEAGDVVRAQVVGGENNMSFSHQAGFYSNSIQLEISVPEGMEVYYTLDGTTPTTDSTLYEAPISITNRTGSTYKYATYENGSYSPSSIYMGTPVRAILVNSRGTIVEEKTASYYIGIGNNSDLVDIPVISITTDPDNLFDFFDGIYVKGRKYYDNIASEAGGSDANYYHGNVKSAYIEYFEPNKDLTYEGEVQINVVADYSVNAPQKSLNIIGDGAWAGSSLEQFFNDVSGNFTLQTNKRDSNSKTRVYLAYELLKETSVGTPKLTPCTVFVDGEYWGLYMIYENYDSNYFEENYGITDEDIVLTQQGVAEKYKYKEEYTDFYNYAISLDMSEDENYQWAKDNMDIQSYLDYFCANMYLANVNYGLEGWHTWKTASVGNGKYADGKWRWLVGNFDYTMSNSQAGNASASSIDTFLQPSVRNDLLFRALLRNEEFRNQLKETMQNMMDNVFEPDRVKNELSIISDNISKAVTETYERFLSSNSSNMYSKQIDDIQSFFDERGYYMSVYIDEIDGLEERFISFEEEEAKAEAETEDEDELEVIQDDQN